MDPHSMGIQGSGMSMPMSMGMNAANPQAMSMGMNSQAIYNQPNTMMNAISAGSNSNVINPAQVSDWRIQLTREHRANLIAKIYNEMVRVSADSVPGIKLWMNVSWYELSLYKESPTQEVYINKIFTRLKSLRAQQSGMNAAMAAQGLPNQGMLSRLDFSYYNTLNLNLRGSQVSSYSGHNQLGASNFNFGPQQQQQQQRQQQQQQQKSVSANSTPVKPETSALGNSAAEYWQQHAALRAKHQGDVEKVHNAFKKYVDHMKGHDETEQKKKLRYLLSYVELCANILGEDKATHPPRKIEELDKVFKYIVKIVNPYLKKLRTETDRRGGDGNTTGSSGLSTSLTGPGLAMGATTSTAHSTTPMSGFSSTTAQAQYAGQSQQQNAMNTSAQLKQQQQQYLIQQRVQQQMQVQARQQQMLQHQQMMRQHQMQQQKSSLQQAQLSAQQANQINQQQNSQNAAKPDNGQQTQQQMGLQVPSRQQQSSVALQQKLSQSQQAQPQQNQNQIQNLQPPTSRGENQSNRSGLSLGVVDSLYGSIGNELLQMPTPSGSTSSGLMDFSNALSPTSFGTMDLLDWDDGTSQGTSGQGAIGTSGGDTSDLMSFVETL